MFLFESFPSEEELSPPLSEEELLSLLPPESEVEFLLPDLEDLLFLPPPEEELPPSLLEGELGPEDGVAGADESPMP